MGKISVREEAAGTPGFVEIAIAGPASGVAGVTIKQRHGDKPFLGQDGWQGQPAVLAPVRVTEGERETVLLYGPAVTQNLVLDQDVTVQLPDGTSERHFWPHIADALGGATVDLGIPRAASPVTGSGSGPNRPPVGPGPPVGDPPIDPPLTLPVEPRPRKHLWLGLLLAGLLLLAAGITAYFLRDRLWPRSSRP
ncbi:hypothetical protein [Breoghania sp. L-A4]|uniref:hypothetical protein n=1 Tax=Breoghania sp. L-A4 TaxID=2304600 RepID=UPI000E359B42|nr:hypothetical protein [Breoghania sp. L-A4]AXS40690.1 hypothetical protein D1F64_12260 [Breoghania sp. L-A4]